MNIHKSVDRISDREMMFRRYEVARDYTKIADHNLAFQRFSREQSRRERLHLIRRGVIIPAYATPPQMMVKVFSDGTSGEGVWKPEIKYA